MWSWRHAVLPCCLPLREPQLAAWFRCSFQSKIEEHQRGRIENRVRILSSLFAITTFSYAVRPNYLHLVINLIPTEAKSLTDNQFYERWTHLFTGPPDDEFLNRLIKLYRNRLGKLSWFMKYLNKYIANQANKEGNQRRLCQVTVMVRHGLFLTSI